MGPLGCRKTPAMYRSHRKCFTAINRGEITRELPLAWYLPTTIWTGAFFSSITFDFPPHFLSRLNVTTLGGFNVAFNPHRLIITLTFTLHSIKFLTADLLQWLFVLQQVAVITQVMGSLRFNAASNGKYSGNTVFWKGRAEFQLPGDKAPQERTEILLYQVWDDLGTRSGTALPLPPLLPRLLSQLLGNCWDGEIGVAMIHPGLVHHHAPQPPE